MRGAGLVINRILTDVSDRDIHFLLECFTFFGFNFMFEKAQSY